MNLPNWILTLITLLSVTITFGCIIMAYRSWSYAKKVQTIEDPYTDLPTSRYSTSRYADLPTSRYSTSRYTNLPTRRYSTSRYTDLPTNRSTNPTRRLTTRSTPEAIASRSLRSLPSIEPPLYENDFYDIDSYDDVFPPPLSRIDHIIRAKEHKFLKISNAIFHFIDHEQVREIYNDYFKEPTIESLVSTITSETDSGIKGSLLPIIETNIGSKGISEWVKTIKYPDKTLKGMFLQYQRTTIEKKEVTLGIEEVDIELNELQSFEDFIEKLNDRFNLVINDSLLDTKRADLKMKAAEKTLSKLEKAADQVLIEGNFNVLIDKNTCKYTYNHPVNEYLFGQELPVKITILIPINSLEERVKISYENLGDRQIPLKVFGQVFLPIDRKANKWDLQIDPLAIY